MVAELLDLRAEAPWSPDRIKVPVLAVHGQHGAPHHAAAMSALGDLMDDIEVAELEGARHFGPNTHPGPMAEIVADFFDRRLSAGQ